VTAPVLAPAASNSGLVAATRARLALPVRLAAGGRLPAGLQLGVRWQPVLLDVPAGQAGTTSGRPSAVPSQAPGSPAAFPPAIDLVAVEAPAAVVTVLPARLVRGRLIVTVDLPAEPGRYRLVTTIHGPDGVAFDDPSQALIPALSVKVSPRLSVVYGVTPALTLATGSLIALPVRLANDGALWWADPPVASEDLRDPRSNDRLGPRLVAQWLPLGADTSRTAYPAIVNAPRLAPGQQATVVLSLVAPSQPGEYLLVIDLLSPLHGSLAAAGVPPAGVRVTVDPAPPPGPELLPRPSPI
jgi:hypothetical protein